MQRTKAARRKRNREQSPAHNNKKSPQGACCGGGNRIPQSEAGKKERSQRNGQLEGVNQPALMSASAAEPQPNLTTTLERKELPPHGFQFFRFPPILSLVYLSLFLVLGSNPARTSPSSLPKDHNTDSTWKTTACSRPTNPNQTKLDQANTTYNTTS